MNLVEVGLGVRSYGIEIRSGGIAPLGDGITRCFGGSEIIVISDEIVAELYLEEALHSLRSAGHTACGAVMSAGEASKTLDSVRDLWQTLMENGAHRNTLLVALGGGVVGDIAGFVAATYNRGLRCVQVPTTLLSQVDSSVGGKTGFNFGGIKNVIGAFHQPARVFTFLGTLDTLDDRQLIAGMGEVVKHAVLGRGDILGKLRDNPGALIRRDAALLESLVVACCEVKRDIVVADELESGKRKLLNLGHTFGHAIETVTEHRILHGEAVALGMVATCRLSEIFGLCHSSVRDELVEALESAGLPTNDAPFWTPQVAEAMVLDKKRRGRDIDLVLLSEIGRPVLQRVSLEKLVGLVSNGL